MEGMGVLQKIVKKRAVLRKFVIFFVLLIIVITLSIISKPFLTATNLYNVGTQVALIIITGSAVNLLMISGNLDLSVGSIIGVSVVAFAELSFYGIPVWLSAILSVVFIGGLVGFINGVMVARLKITPVIATLGMMYVARGLAYILCGGVPVTGPFPNGFGFLGRTFIGQVPLIILIFIGILLIFYFIQEYTIIGKYAYAIGGNKLAAKLSGINQENVVMLLYILVGLLAGFSGIIQASRLGAGQPLTGQGFEFDVIIAVVLGGTSLSGGEGSIIGMVIGAFIVGFLANGLNLLGVQSYYQQVVKGIVLVLAILLDRVLKERLV